MNFKAQKSRNNVLLKTLFGALYFTLFLAFPGRAVLTHQITVLGDSNSQVTWGYLCGLTDVFDSEEEVENRNKLDRIGKNAGVRFLAIHPFERCEPAGNKLCWRHYTEDEAFQTYEMLKETLENEPISGMVGFSNGGYYLNYLSQIMKLDWPILSIGAAGEMAGAKESNRLTLMVGKREVIYSSAIKFAELGNRSALKVTLIEHDGGHMIPETMLLKFFAGSTSNTKKN